MAAFARALSQNEALKGAFSVVSDWCGFFIETNHPGQPRPLKHAVSPFGSQRYVLSAADQGLCGHDDGCSGG